MNGHAYSLIAVKQVMDAATFDMTTIVQLRNPWGDFEWKGDWSDESEKWTPEIKQMIGFKGEDDGTFWMSLEDM